MATDARSLARRARAAAAGLGSSVRVCRDTLRRPDLRRAELAFLGFNMAEWAVYIAVAVYAFQQGGAAAVGLVSLIQLVPAAVFAPFAALLGDRYRREAVLTAAYAVQVLTMGATAGALLLDAPAPVVYALSAVTATGLTLVRPVHASLLPALTRSPEELTAAYVTDGAIESTSIVLGPLLAGAIMIVSGPGTVYAVMAGLLVVSALFAGQIGVRTTRPAEPPEGTRMREEALAGFQLVRDDPSARLVIGVLGSGLFVLGILDVLIVVLAFELFDSGEAGAGFLNAVLGLGGMIGSALTLSLVARQRLFEPMRNGMLLGGLPTALIAAAPVPGLAVPAFAATGAGLSLTDVSGRMMLQRLVPDQTLARAFGVLEGAYMASEGLGAVVGAVLVEVVGLEGTLIACGLFLPALGLLARQRLLDADVGMLARPEHVELLHALPLFAALGPREVELLAQQLRPVDAAAGDAVITEGDVGDSFYVIETGAAEVTHEGRHIRSLADGDYFGEIALLRAVPRTATVTAQTPMRLLALDRQTFLEAVTRYAPGVHAANEIVEARLATPTGAGRS
jgi:MFS family permease